MAKSLTQILQRASGDNLEEDMRQLVRERHVREEPPPIPMRPLSEEAKELYSKSMPLAAQQLVDEADKAMKGYEEATQRMRERLDLWKTIVTQTTEKAAREIAEGHAAMMAAAELFEQAMAKLPGVTLPPTTQLEERHDG